MENEQKNKDVLLPASIIVAAVLISGSIFYMVGKNQNGNPPVDNTVNQPTNAAEILKIQGGEVVLGESDAPVTIVEYGDYQCPWCSKFFEESEKPLRDEYIKTGKVKMVYRDFPIDSIHPFARVAAEAANCAKDQSKFWLYHDALLDKQKDIPTMDFVSLATELGFETATFKACFENGKYKDEIQKDFDGAVAAGVNGTPAVFINGQQVGGFLTYDQLKVAVDSALNK